MVENRAEKINQEALKNPQKKDEIHKPGGARCKALKPKWKTSQVELCIFSILLDDRWMNF